MKAKSSDFWSVAGSYAWLGGVLLAALASVGYAVQYFIALQSEPSLWGALIFLPIYLLIFAALGGFFGAIMGFTVGVIRYFLKSSDRELEQ
jgi:hypothetical protein